jgi:hypothetical protein
MNKGRLLAAAVASFAFAIPATAQQTDKSIPPSGLAQNQAECLAQFNAADINNDGVLSREEVSQFKTNLPTEFGGKTDLNRQEFLASCEATAKRSRQP